MCSCKHKCAEVLFSAKRHKASVLHRLHLLLLTHCHPIGPQGTGLFSDWLWEPMSDMMGPLRSQPEVLIDKSSGKPQGCCVEFSACVFLKVITHPSGFYKTAPLSMSPSLLSFFQSQRDFHHNRRVQE